MLDGKQLEEEVDHTEIIGEILEVVDRTVEVDVDRPRTVGTGIMVDLERPPTIRQFGATLYCMSLCGAAADLRRLT